jgi:DNA segregation ATPase FtsK/SpoIIIE-like protein
MPYMSENEYDEIKKKLNLLEKKIDELSSKMDELLDGVEVEYEQDPLLDPNELDELFVDAVYAVSQYDFASAVLLQKKLQIGFNRAARLIEQLESAGVVGPQEGAKAREVLIQDAKEFLSIFLDEKFKN